MDGSTNGAGIRAARNQSLFRSINEQIEEMNEAFQSLVEDPDYVCECAKNEHRRVATGLSRNTRRFHHFFVKRGHVHPEFEHVVEEHDGWVIVEKFGEAGAEAVALAHEEEKRSLAQT
jgi:hypothetical protein